MMRDRLIVQIVPSNGWQAMYAFRPERNAGSSVWRSPVACWALVQHDATRSVVGLDSNLSFCDAGDNFLGYLGPGEDAAQWEEAARRTLCGEVNHGRSIDRTGGSKSLNLLQRWRRRKQ